MSRRQGACLIKNRGVTPFGLSLATTLFVVIVLNGAFWSHIYRVVKPDDAYEWALLASFFVLQSAVYLFVLSIAAFPWLLKTLAAVMVLLAAVSSFFMLEYGAVIDANMLRNVLETNPAEAGDLMTGRAVAWIVVLGILPAVAIFLAPLTWRPARQLLPRNAFMSFAAAATAGLTFLSFSGGYFSLMREDREAVLKSTPANVVIAGVRLHNRSKRVKNIVIAPVGEDARLARPAGARPLVTVVVVGETARAANFSLLGYNRETNPELGKTPGVVAFSHVTSCGTDTAYSVPCMFSGLGRAKYSFEVAQRRENLLDVVKRSGLHVEWIENQGGCKGVCARVPTTSLTQSTNPRFCAEGECHDEILLDGLSERIAAMKDGGVIVLHMMGSHGPAYYKRVPHGFRPFEPVCETSQFARCTSEQIVNSYDNTIAYTDRVLAGLVRILEKAAGSERDTMMFYVSDHGESLGEGGMYLHGMPYALAPEHQKHVPMVLWLSEGARATQAISASCIEERARTSAYSHDNLFHTVLGAQSVSTSVYSADLDILQPCRNHHPM